ncbi:MAG: formylglycine-generating enzyme family protein [Planctomycetia bacterium]|nr:formylglycine-generating enzyme family protein [Planctomycetia bacterium]
MLELLITGVPVNFHWAPAGSFLMGSPESEDGRREYETQHAVLLTQGFWVAETETTQELWQAFMGNNPSRFGGSEQLPVERVSWYDCQEFVQKLNDFYSSVLPNGYKYAMPTEAQWEYACRAGTTTPFHFGDSLNGDKANCNGDYPYGTSAKGRILREDDAGEELRGERLGLVRHARQCVGMDVGLVRSRLWFVRRRTRFGGNTGSDRS